MKTETVLLGGVGITALGIILYKYLVKPSSEPPLPPSPPPPEIPELAYFDTYILWEKFGKTLWHHTWLKLSEDTVGVVPAGTENHPVRVKRVSAYIGATEQLGSALIKLEIYQNGTPINSKSDTTALQWYVGPQQFRGSIDWYILGEAGSTPGQYQLVATAMIGDQTITRTYNYTIEGV